jgi:hypothetical protein
MVRQYQLKISRVNTWNIKLYLDLLEISMFYGQP